MFMNAWEFKINNKIDSKSLRGATYNMIFTEIREMEVIKIQKDRTDEEWRKLYLIRSLSIFANVLLISASAFAIIETNINKISIVDWVKV